MNSFGLLFTFRLRDCAAAFRYRRISPRLRSIFLCIHSRRFLLAEKFGLSYPNLQSYHIVNQLYVTPLGLFMNHYFTTVDTFIALGDCNDFNIDWIIYEKGGREPVTSISLFYPQCVTHLQNLNN